MATQPRGGSGGSGRRGGDTNLAHLFQSLEAAMKTSESLTAEQKIRAVLDAAAQSCHHASQAKYKKILKTGNRWLLGMDRKLEARRQRKLLDAAAQYLDHASDAIAAVILRDQQILDAAKKPKPQEYDAAS
jgi:hypothetical protein